MSQESWSENSTRILEKTLKMSKMNDTYAMWKQIVKKKSSQRKPLHDQLPRFVTSNDISVAKKMKEKVKKNDVRGLTLDEYFKTREQLEQQSQTPRINEQNQEQINKYCNEKFDVQTIYKVQETKHKNVQTPNFSQQSNIQSKPTKKRSNNKQKNRTTKLKTQTNEPQSLHKDSSKIRNKTHFQTIVDKQTLMLTTFQKAPEKKSILPQKIQFSPQRFFKKKPFIKAQNMMNIQATDLSFVTKHAIKFNINRDLCRQLILDQLRS